MLPSLGPAPANPLPGLRPFPSVERTSFPLARGGAPAARGCSTAIEPSIRSGGRGKRRRGSALRDADQRLTGRLLAHAQPLLLGRLASYTKHGEGALHGRPSLGVSGASPAQPETPVFCERLLPLRASLPRHLPVISYTLRRSHAKADSHPPAILALVGTGQPNPTSPSSHPAGNFDFEP